MTKDENSAEKLAKGVIRKLKKRSCTDGPK